MTAGTAGNRFSADLGGGGLDPRRPQSQPVSDRARRIDAGWRLGLPKEVVISRLVSRVPQIIAVGGGKGGVGKSLVAANLGIKLAERGRRVLLVDLDVGCANLHTHLGIAFPDRTLADFLIRDRWSFGEIALPTAFPRLRLIAGGRDQAWTAYQRQGDSGALYARLWNAIMRAVELVGVDVVVLDLGAGTHHHTMDFFTLAQVGVLVVLPEPTSIENAYVFLKAALWRLMDHAAGRSGDEGENIRRIRTALGVGDGGAQQTGYAERIQLNAAQWPGAAATIQAAVGGRLVGLVVNQARSQQDIDIGKSMEVIARRYFGFDTSYLGYLGYEEAVWKSLRNKRVLAKDFPHSALSQRLVSISDRLLQELDNRVPQGVHSP